MPLNERQQIMQEIEALRGGRKLVCFFNFDRQSEPQIPGFATQFASDTKEPLFRVLRESSASSKTGIDLCLYTRGGDTNSVWPIVSLIREFDPRFEVLVPFRCHSAGTMVALGASKIVMSTLGELSPIDPSTGNQFNPTDPSDLKTRLPISVEDVTAYRRFVLEQFNFKSEKPEGDSWREFLRPGLERLTAQVHPIALGNVHRAHQQSKQLARVLLGLNPVKGEKVDRIVDALTTRFYSHLHMINRNEAKEILGERVEAAEPKLDQALDRLLRTYENDFNLRKPFFSRHHLGEKLSDPDARIVGAAVESRHWSYLFETLAVLSQFSQLPANVQVQLPPGQPMPLIPGLPRAYGIEVLSAVWMHNTEPKGVTV